MKWFFLTVLTICTAGNALASVSLKPGDNIQAAIDANPPGTIFYLAAGIYRGQNLSPKNDSKFYGVAGQTFLNGSVVIGGWTRSGSNWVSSTGVPTPLAYNASIPAQSSSPLAQHRNDLFVNNRLYTRATSRAAVTSGTWYFDESSRTAYLTDDPTGKTVEISAAPRALTGHDQPAWGGANVTIQDIVVEKYASNSQDVALAAGYGWILNNVTARWNHGGGASIGANSRIEGGSFSYNGEEGIFFFNASNAVIHWAEVAWNNYAGYDWNYEGGGMKGGTTRGNPSASNIQIINNWVHDNNGHGIHLDSDSSQTTYAYNTISNNAMLGILDECNYAPIIHDNYLSLNGSAGTHYAQFGQITFNDTQYAQVYNNNIVVGDSAGNGITMMSIDRGSSSLLGIVYRISHNRVNNNTVLYWGNRGFSGMVFWDRPDDGSNSWDYNNYYMPDRSQPHWFFGNGDQYTWTQVHSITTQEPHGQALAGHP